MTYLTPNRDALVEDLRDEVATAIPGAALGCCADCPVRHAEGDADDQAAEIADALLPLIAQREAAARADERERVARGLSALPTTRTQAWLTGWDSISQTDALRIARGDA